MDHPVLEQPASRLVPVTSKTLDSVEKVNDSGNRSIRTAQNVAFIGLLIGALNRATGLNLTVDQALIVLAVVTPALAYLRNVAEYRGWIPSTKDKDAEVAPPTNVDGQALGQVK